jgi:hypothetical protein
MVLYPHISDGLFMDFKINLFKMDKTTIIYVNQNKIISKILEDKINF